MGEGDREAFSDASTKPMARACAPDPRRARSSSGRAPGDALAGVKRERTIITEATKKGTGLQVRLHGVTVRFPAPAGSLEALRGLTLDIPAGSLTVVIGPNGCGKSTLLRVIAGLLQPSDGGVLVGDSAPRAGDGRVGLAFQQPRLLPWLSTLDNVALPLALGGKPGADEQAAEALARVGLAEATELRPAQLSGGMSQRAGLARALISDPLVLLLDEPFSALDALTREGFDGDLQRIWMDRPQTVVMVTHSVGEAVRMADRIVVMTPRPGRVAEIIPVDLPRPRPATIASDPAAAAIDAAVRAILAEVRPPELTPWVDR
jgi:NitT/TauT family transport system ATP-binding protein